MTFKELEKQVRERFPNAEVRLVIDPKGGPLVVVRKTVEFCFGEVEAPRFNRVSLSRECLSRMRGEAIAGFDHWIEEDEAVAVILAAAG